MTLEKHSTYTNDNDFDYFETEEKGHGRVKTRSYWITNAATNVRRDSP